MRLLRVGNIGGSTSVVTVNHCKHISATIITACQHHHIAQIISVFSEAIDLKSCICQDKLVFFSLKVYINSIDFF